MPRYYKVKVSVSLVTGPYILSFLLIHLNKTGCFFLMLLINVSHFSFSQSNFSHFEHINSENGLPQNSVYVICQDKQGFMWFGTADGLCRYDGNEIRVFRKDPFDTNSLPGNFIRRLISDSKGILWIGTESGICCYDPVTEKFKRVHIPGESDITSVAFPFYETKSGEIFFGWNNKKYFKINQHNWVVKEETFSSKIKESFRGSSIYSMISCDQKIVFSKGSSVNIYSVENKEIREILIKDSSFIMLTAAVKIKDSLWIGTLNGIIVINTKDGNYRYIKEIKVNGIFNKIGPVNTINISSKGELLIGTNNQGLFIIRNNFYSTEKYVNNISDPNSISFNSVTSLFCDKSGNIWIGTDAKGINKISSNVRFKHYCVQKSGSDFLSSDFIRCFFIDEEGYLFVGMHDGGLAVINPQRTTSTIFRSKTTGQHSLPSDNVSCILKDSKGNIWTGTDRGLSCFNKDKGRFDNHFKGKENEFVITALSENKRGELLVGTKKTVKIIYLDSSIRMRDIENKHLGHAVNFTSDVRRNIYVGSAANYLGNIKCNFFTFKNNNGNFFIFAGTKHFFVDSEGYLWLATMSGLEKRDNRGILLKTYTEKNGLPNTSLYSVLPDKKGNLWISTNNGISKFNLTKQTFTNYDIEDGLQSNEFNSGAFYSSERGEFFFGGINGFNSFFPDSIKDNPVVPEVAITSCKIFDEEWKGDTSLTLLHSLILPYNQNTLSFAFAPLEFTQPEKNLIKYRLIGLDTHWVSLGEERKVSFIGLSSGKYILQAKACNNDGIWNRIPKQLNIIIVPPLWKRPWFMALFVLLLLSAFGILIRYFSTRKLKRKLEILERHRILEEERTRISRDMHDEIGAGLSKISLLCEISKKKDNLSDDTRMQMEKITTSSRQIVDNMGEIIWSLNPKHDTLYELLSYMRDYIYEYFEALPIKLSLKFPEIDVFSAVTIDARFRRNIFLVVKEALHNIVKHSSATVAIVDIEIVKEKMTILISDNGKGICTDDMPGKYSNGLKNMKQRITEIGGEIKIVSEQNKGTLIRIVCVNQAFDSVTNTTLM